MRPHLHLYSVWAHARRAVSKDGKLNSKHRLWPHNICLAFYSLCKPNLLTESQAQTATHLTRLSPHLPFPTLSCVGFHMCLDRHIFLWCNYCTHEGKARGEKKRERIKEDFLAEEDWTLHCLLSQWQPRTISAYGSLWGKRTITTAF